jgi:hypothetical protein
MRSVTIFSRSIIQQQRLAYSFNTLTNNTSFDAQQNIVSELSPSPKAYHGAPANHYSSKAISKARRSGGSPRQELWKYSQ